MDEYASSIVDVYFGIKKYNKALEILYEFKDLLEKKFINAKWYNEVLKKIRYVRIKYKIRKKICQVYIVN